MKKIILLMFIIVLLPVLAFAKLEIESFKFDYTYDWISFLGRGTQEYGKKGNWKYGYNEWDNGVDGYGHKHLFIPKKPNVFKCPSYLSNYPLMNKNITASDIKNNMFTEKDAVRLVRSQNMSSFEEGILFGVTINNDWFVINNCSYITIRMSSDPHDKFRPFSDAKVNIMKTIMMHCETEKREPTISEKYIMLYLEMCGDQLSKELDQAYQQYYAKEYHASQKSEYFQMWVTGPLKLLGWCLLALFAFMLPGLILVLLQCIFPKGSIIYNAVCTLEVMLGIFAISYWFGSRR